MDATSFFSPVTQELLSFVADYEERQEIARLMMEQGRVELGEFAGKFTVDGEDKTN